MTKYIEIKGHSIQSTDTDPEPNAGVWSSGGTMNSARTGKQSGATGNDNVIVAGGYNASSSPPTAPRTLSESYNGTAWTETSENNDGRQFGGGAGTNTNAIIAGGDPSSFYTAAETWNGSAWTEAPNMNTNKNQNAMTGNATAAITIGGGNPGAIDSVESWDGSSWTETAYDLNTAKKYVWATGTTTAALASGTPTTTESLDGTTWTEVTESSTDHRSGAASGARDDCLVFGGDNGPGQVAKTEQWNGSSWTEVNDLATARSYLGGSGNTPDSATAIAFGGSGLPAETGATEEWAFPSAPAVQLGQVWYNADSTTYKAYVAQGTGAWASGTNLNTARYGGSGLGTSADSGLVAGSNPAGDAVEQYNGSSWTEVSEINTSRYISSTGFGSVTAGLIASGGPSPAALAVETWDGSSWSEVGEVNEGRTSYASSSSSPQTTGFIAGCSGEDKTETWNGTSWTEVGDLNTGRDGVAGAGSSSTSGLAFGGVPNRAVNESWDGSSWTEVGDLNTGREYLNGSGIQTGAVAFAGRTSPPQTFKVETESWNGSSWTELADLATGRLQGTSGGTSVSAFYAGGEAPGNSAATEEWSVPGVTKTLTVS